MKLKLEITQIEKSSLKQFFIGLLTDVLIVIVALLMRKGFTLFWDIGNMSPNYVLGLIISFSFLLGMDLQKYISTVKYHKP